MGNDSAIETLHVFNDKTARLERTAFRSWLDSADLGWSFWKVGDYWHVEWDRLDEDSADAFLLTLRFFVQDTDGISMRRIAEIYDPLPSYHQQHTRPASTWRHQCLRHNRSSSYAGSRHVLVSWSGLSCRFGIDERENRSAGLSDTQAP